MDKDVRFRHGEEGESGEGEGEGEGESIRGGGMSPPADAVSAISVDPQRALSLIARLFEAKCKADIGPALAPEAAISTGSTHSAVVLCEPESEGLVISHWPEEGEDGPPRINAFMPLLEYLQQSRDSCVRSGLSGPESADSVPESPLAGCHWAAVPLVVAERVAGLLCVSNNAQPYDDAQVATLRLLAQLAGCAHGYLSVEAERKDALARLEYIYALNRDALWVLHPRENSFFPSPTWFTLFGYEEGEVRTLDAFRALLPAEDLESSDRELPPLLVSDAPWALEHRLRARDGQLRWVRVRGKVVERAGDGAPHKIVGIHEDITEEKQARDALVESERKYRMLADNSRDMIWVTDAKLNITYVSPVAESMLGYPPDEMCGLNVRDLLTRETWYQAQKIIQSAFDKPGRGKVTMELEHICRDGARMWTEVVAASLLDDQSHVLGFQGSTRNIAMRKENEQEIARLRRAVEHASDGIAIAETDGTVIFQNSALAAMLGFASPSEINAAGGAYSVFPDSTRVEEVLGLLRGGEAYAMDLRLRRQNGSVFESHLRASPVRDSDGRITHLMAIVSDISEKKKAEEERRALEARVMQGQKLESLGILAGGIAHDFNNLLMSILGNAELVRDELPPDSTTRDMLTDIESSARRASELSRQMLAYSGHGLTNKRPVDLNALLRDMLPSMRASASKEAAVELNLSPSVPQIDADSSQLRQVILRLVLNASEALQEKSGVITLETGALECDSAYLYEPYMGQQLTPGSYVYLDVRDTGCGIAPDIRARIFDPFFTTKFTGRGLGLSMAHGVRAGAPGLH